MFIGLPLLWVAWSMGRYGGRFGNHSTPFILDTMGHGKLRNYFGVYGIFADVPGTVAAIRSQVDGLRVDIAQKPSCYNTEVGRTKRCFSEEAPQLPPPHDSTVVVKAIRTSAPDRLVGSRGPGACGGNRKIRINSIFYADMSRLSLLSVFADVCYIVYLARLKRKRSLV
ncbi:MAG: hypothetical protein ACK50T_00825 [Sphingobacteriia bacterium]